VPLFTDYSFPIIAEVLTGVGQDKSKREGRQGECDEQQCHERDKIALMCLFHGSLLVNQLCIVKTKPQNTQRFKKP
jgi:hypothetical protein